ncbi:MAG: hypothetical protein [Microvirus sp.]|nr:MAG: hypothetical protein [Microvirus sp.]
MKRYKMSRGKSRREFKRGDKFHKKNFYNSSAMRGGIRL